jgi:hypothetical protein
MTRGVNRPQMTRLYSVVREIIGYHKIYDSRLHNTVETEGSMYSRELLPL